MSAAAPSRRRRDSCPSDEVVVGFFFEFEAIRTASTDRDAPRRCAPVLETQLSALEREAFFDLCAKYRPCIRLMYDASDEEKARVELLESLLNAADVAEDEEGVEEEKGA